MEKKRYVVRLTFTTQVEADDDSQALADAAYRLRYGFSATRNTELKIVAALPIAETPALAEVPKTTEEVLQPPVATLSNDFPF